MFAFPKYVEEIIEHLLVRLKKINHPVARATCMLKISSVFEYYINEFWDYARGKNMTIDVHVHINFLKYTTLLKRQLTFSVC